MGCCDKADGEYPKDAELCCGGTMKGRRCFCLPYDDPYFITAQILSIVALFLSWVFWGALIVSVVGFILLQICWCCRQTRGFMYASFGVAVVSALASIAVGIYALVVFPNFTDCYAFDFAHYGKKSDPWYDDYDYYWCQYKAWATISFVCAALWIVVAALLMRFITSGRFARWEEFYNGNNNGNVDDIEAVAVEQQGSVPQQAEGADVEAVAVEKGSVPQAEEATAAVVSAPEEIAKAEEVNG